MREMLKRELFLPRKFPDLRYVNPHLEVINSNPSSYKVAIAWFLKHNFHICDIKQSVAIFVSLHIGAVGYAICWLVG